jgi:hypothetical protein
MTVTVDVQPNAIESAVAAACAAAVEACVAAFIGVLGLRGMLLDPAIIRAAVRAELGGIDE